LKWPFYHDKCATLTKNSFAVFRCYANKEEDCGMEVANKKEQQRYYFEEVGDHLF